MAAASKKLLALRAQEQRLREELHTATRTTLGRLSRTLFRVGAAASTSMAVYALTYRLLRRNTRKPVPPAVPVPAPAAPAPASPQASFLMRLLHRLLVLSTEKSPYPYFKYLLPKASKAGRSTGLSVLVAILPWFLRLLADAYGRRKSRTSS